MYVAFTVFIKLTHGFAVLMNYFTLFYWLLILSAPTFAQDDLQWLRDDSRSNTQVIDYLSNENTQTEKFKATLEPKINELLQEWQDNHPIKSQQPWHIIGNAEYAITQHDGQRQLLSRSLKTKKLTVLFNISERSNSFDYYHLGRWALSNDHKTLAISEDLTGSEQYQISVIDLKTQTITTLIHNVDSSIMWSHDDRSLYLIKQEDLSSRPFELVEFTLANSTIKSIAKEQTKDWLLSFYQASDLDYALVQSNNDNSSEQRVLNLITGHLSSPIKPRIEGIEYYADIANNAVVINSNIKDHHFALYSVPLTKMTEITHWKSLFRPLPDHPLTNFYLFLSGPVVSVGNGENAQLIYLNNTGKVRDIEPLTTSGQTAWVSRVGDFKSNTFYIRSMSMIQPPKWEKVNSSTLERTLYSQDNYPTITPSRYVTEQIIMTDNGVDLPITLAYRKDKIHSDSPVFLYGYGAYGVTMKPYFMPQIISLLDRGVIYAIAHVRGGGYNGDAWYNAGRGLNRQHATTDFITAAKTMRHYHNGPHPIYALGSSAGGTLVASAINQQPDVFQGATLNVPFVDVVNSMSDPTLPLTMQQYSEWGNPTIPDELRIMKQTDPYSNITKQAYPPLLVQVGFHDRRVPYWEGAKYLTKIRNKSTGSGPYLLETHFNQGHATDRRDALAQQAFEYIFLLSLTNN